MADKYAFLSDEWFDAAGKLVAEHSADGPPAPSLVMNLEVTDGENNTTEFHMGARDGATLFGKGHIDGADSRSPPISRLPRGLRGEQPRRGMQAFMAGKVRIQGDMTKLMMAQAGGQGGNPALTEALQSITGVGVNSTSARASRRESAPSASTVVEETASNIPKSRTGARDRAARHAADATGRASRAARTRSPVAPAAAGSLLRAVPGASHCAPGPFPDVHVP